VLGDPSSFEWTDRAVVWVHENELGEADKYEYRSMILTRRLGRGRRVRELAELINAYTKAHELSLVGHSNGCDLLVRALPRISQKVRHLHLFSPACEADLRASGLETLLLTGRLTELHCWIGGEDKAMIAARWSKWLTFGLLGYGTMGLTGPTNVGLAVLPYVHVCCEPTFGHSTWFDARHFDGSMCRITL
jgi:pimeloyl-ACP methyl ester carboxylesterase